MVLYSRPIRKDATSRQGGEESILLATSSPDYGVDCLLEMGASSKARIRRESDSGCT